MRSAFNRLNQMNDGRQAYYDFATASRSRALGCRAELIEIRVLFRKLFHQMVRVLIGICNVALLKVKDVLRQPIDT